MTDEPDLNFENAEYEGSPSANPLCTSCQNPLAGQYYQANEQPICSQCRSHIEQAFGGYPTPSALLHATTAGLAAAIIGTVIYWAVLALSGYEVALVAIVVGVIVAKAVRWGSRGRGGLPFQLIAVFLTYSSICASYVVQDWPAIVDVNQRHKAAAIQKAETRKDNASNHSNDSTTTLNTAPDRVHLSGEEYISLIIMEYAYSLRIPFRNPANNFIKLLIIGFGLFQAWRMTGRPQIRFSGPYDINTSPPTAGPSIDSHA